MVSDIDFTETADGEDCDLVFDDTETTVTNYDMPVGHTYATGDTYTSVFGSNTFDHWKTTSLSAGLKNCVGHGLGCSC